MIKNYLRIAIMFVLVTTLPAARAVLLPVAEDTSSTTAGKINPTTGKAPTLSVTSRQTAFVVFDLSTIPSSLTAGNLGSARLNLYLSSLTTAGELKVHVITNDWSEDGANQYAPGFSSNVVGIIPAADLAAKSFVEVDVTSAVSYWLNGGSNFGLAIATATGNVRLGSKEGLGTGFPALLEIEEAVTAGELNVSELTNGTLPLSSLPGVVVTNNQTGVTLGGTFAGNGAALSDLSAAALTGTIAASNIANGTLTTNLLATNIGVWTASGNNIFYTNGDVGFGTNDPGFPVDVVSAGDPRIESKTTGAGFAGLLTVNAQAAWFAGVDSTPASGDWLLFENSPDNGYRLTITTNGFVGINTPTPTTALQVLGTATATTFSGNGSGLTHTFNGGTNVVINGSTAGVTNTSTNYGTLKIVASGSTFSNFDSGSNWVDATTNFTGTLFLPVGPGAGVQSGSNDLSGSKIFFQ